MSKRDKYLTRALGMCWHEPVTVVGDGYNYYVCKHCGATPLWQPDAFIQPHFSEWKWFHLLHDWVIKDPRFTDMFLKSNYNPYSFPSISPDIFANCVYYYLVEQETKNIPIITLPKKSLIERIKGVFNEKS